MDRIKIHNFGPIKDVDIELSKFMVFIGPQGVGKSTFAKLLTIFSDVNWWLDVCDDKDPLSEFSKMKIDKYFSKDTSIEYFGRDDVHIEYKNGKFSFFLDTIEPQKTSLYCKLLIEEVLKTKLNELGIDINNLPKDNSLITLRNYLRANLRFSCYVPAERNIASILSSSLANIFLSDVPLPKILMEYMSLYEKAKNHFSTYDASFLGIRYTNNNGNDCISVLNNSEKNLPLDECSSGIQSALPMLMILDYSHENKWFDSYVIEEPEQNLFPTNQREILNRLISISHHEGCKYMIITTHSPYLLSALNASMLAAKATNLKRNSESIDDIIQPQFRINSADVSVFSLGDETYCKSIIDEKTGLISVNYLDVVSETISSDFNRLYQIYLNTLKK